MNISKALLIAIMYVISVIAYSNADAIPIEMDGNNPAFALIADCNRNGISYVDCTSSAQLNDAESLVGNNADFKASFNAWNDKNAARAKWTLVNGGNLPGGRFDVTVFNALADRTLGGLKINIDWIYGGRDKHDFKWVQGLYTNYTASPTAIVPAYFKMDVGREKNVTTENCSHNVHRSIRFSTTTGISMTSR